VLGTSFVTKFDAGGRLVYSTYFHGGDASNTYTSSIAADAAGNAYITGDSGGSLPTTPGAFQTSAGAQEAAFVAKLDAKGSTLLYCNVPGGQQPGRRERNLRGQPGQRLCSRRHTTGHAWSGELVPRYAGSIPDCAAGGSSRRRARQLRIHREAECRGIGIGLLDVS